MNESGPGMVIVGAGECGARAALSLRDAGYDGPVTLIGAERHPPYERPPLSKALLAADSDGGPTLVASRERLDDLRIHFIDAAEAVSIDRDKRCVGLRDGRTVPYGRLLLATGAAARTLPMAEGLDRCVTLRTHDDALAIRGQLGPAARMIVIGGGFIGLELAAAARLRGARVMVVETQPRVLMRGVPTEIASVVAAEHAERGVELRCGASILGIDETARGVVVHLADGSAVEGDLCVIGIGAVPNVALARAAGLEIDNGIVVDSRLRTADPDIFAAGDCCAFPLPVYGGRRVRLEAWRNAQDQGAWAARAMLGEDAPYAAVPWFWSDQYDLTLQIAGLADEGATTIRRDLGEGAFLLFHMATDGRLAAASGIGRGNAVARDIRLAEMMIARRAVPAPDRLADPQTKLKSLLPA